MQFKKCDYLLPYICEFDNRYPDELKKNAEVYIGLFADLSATLHKNLCTSNKFLYIYHYWKRLDEAVDNFLTTQAYFNNPEDAIGALKAVSKILNEIMELYLRPRRDDSDNTADEDSDLGNIDTEDRDPTEDRRIPEKYYNYIKTLNDTICDELDINNLSLHENKIDEMAAADRFIAAYEFIQLQLSDKEILDIQRNKLDSNTISLNTWNFIREDNRIDYFIKTYKKLTNTTIDIEQDKAHVLKIMLEEIVNSDKDPDVRKRSQS